MDFIGTGRRRPPFHGSSVITPSLRLPPLWRGLLQISHLPLVIYVLAGTLWPLFLTITISSSQCTANSAFEKFELLRLHLVRAMSSSFCTDFTSFTFNSLPHLFSSASLLLLDISSSTCMFRYDLVTNAVAVDESGPVRGSPLPTASASLILLG